MNNLKGKLTKMNPKKVWCAYISNESVWYGMLMDIH